MIEEVIKAANQLASKRVGALVVFERGAPLSEFIEEGTILDAAVSRELLYSISSASFENPMHDGALIIRDGRVWQAGAFLPLARAVDRSLGARHRAALGITQETDAVVVVVSEERGAVSLCFDGNIVRNWTPARFETRSLGSSIAPSARASFPGRRSSRPPLPRVSTGSSGSSAGTTGAPTTGTTPAAEARASATTEGTPARRLDPTSGPVSEPETGSHPRLPPDEGEGA